ncbi:MAG: nucleotidyltransferase domain-containing protein [Chitinophagaceae bacterium]
MLTIENIRKNGWLIFEAIVGSKAYGLDTAKSDTDIRGVFVLPKEIFYSLDYTPQVSNESNDIVYYELKRFVELLSKNNPNIMELLNMPERCILQKHEIMNSVKPEMFLSKLCEQTFANYAYTQIKKAYGLEKKIVNPVEEERKSVLDFCFVHIGKEALPLQQFLSDNGFKQEEMGLTAITHFRDCYNLYYSRMHTYAGVMKKEESNDVCLSSIPKGEKPVGLLYFNKDGYSVYCKRYKEYWEWVAKRNEERYNTTMSHGKNYDSKNMMHVFRLLFTAKEIATEGKINVWRKDREFLLSIKQGKYEYDDLVARAEVLKDELNDLYARSTLKDEPNMEEVNRLLIEMREKYYLEKE